MSVQLTSTATASQPLYPVSKQDVCQYLGTKDFAAASRKPCCISACFSRCVNRGRRFSLPTKDGSLYFNRAVVVSHFKKQHENIPLTQVKQVFAKIVFIHALREKLKTDQLNPADVDSLSTLPLQIKVLPQPKQEFPPIFQPTLYNQFSVSVDEHATAEALEFVKEFQQKIVEADKKLIRAREEFSVTQLSQKQPSETSPVLATPEPVVAPVVASVSEKKVDEVSEKKEKTEPGTGLSTAPVLPSIPEPVVAPASPSISASNVASVVASIVEKKIVEGQEAKK